MSYATAHFPRGTVVAGIRLRPLSLGHALLLARLGCPLIPGGSARVPKRGDVATLLWVCSRPWRRAVVALGGWRSRLWRAFVAGRLLQNHEETVVAAQSYLRDQISGPEATPSKTGGGTLHAPTLAILKVAGMCELGLTEEEVLDRPMGLTVWETMVAAERRGDVELKPSLDHFHGLLAAAKALETEVPLGQ